MRARPLHCHDSVVEGAGSSLRIRKQGQLCRLQGDRWALMRMFSGLNEGNCLYQRL